MKDITNNLIYSFVAEVQKSIELKTFVKLTLSKSTQSVLPQNVYARFIQSKKGNLLSCTLRYSNKDITQNLTPGDELSEQLVKWLTDAFKNAVLICKEEEFIFQLNNKNEASLRSKKKKKEIDVEVSGHDKARNYLIKEDSAFLKLLALSSSEGRIFKDQQDKYRQINKYCEIMLVQLEQNGLLEKGSQVQIVDMGSGKGYLTFALYQLLKEQKGIDVQILGVELRQELCDFCNEQAKNLGWEKGLRFVAMDILNYNEGDIDVLIALHACDIATDIAIAQGIKNEASLIVVAPCCHKQIRKQMNPTAAWKEILKNGILLERQAELITDALRALLLEQNAYKTKVFEFISTAHTPKNVMITAAKKKKTLNKEEKIKIEADIEGLKTTFGIEEHYLEKLLKGDSVGF